MWEEVKGLKMESLETNVLSLEGGGYWMTEKSKDLYVRECYKPLAELIYRYYMNGTKPGKTYNGVVLLGNPGLGKSWFLNFLLVYFWLKGVKTIVFESVGEEMIWVFNESNVNCFTKGTHVPELNNPETLFLFDPYGNGNPREPKQCSAFGVIAASPNPSHYKQFHKNVGRKLYIPVWSLEELERLCQKMKSLSHYFPSFSEVKEYFMKYGGVLRYIIGGEQFLEDLKTAIGACSLDHIQKLNGGLENVCNFFVLE
jgi:hypothetical protein